MSDVKGLQKKKVMPAFSLARFDALPIVAVHPSQTIPRTDTMLRLHNNTDQQAIFIKPDTSSPQTMNMMTAQFRIRMPKAVISVYHTYALRFRSTPSSNTI
jgi:hypothetical protein